MRKIKSYKGFIIAEDKKQPDTLFLFTKDEWDCGEGFRYPEWEAGNMKEATDFIDS
jgi:hypothetical protein